MVTASTDGRVNFWSLANLRDPADTVQVADSVSTCTVIEAAERLMVGDDHGNLYSMPTSGRKKVKKYQSSTEEGESLGHYGLVSAIAMQHKGRGLMATAGVDWTVKLWTASQETPIWSWTSHSYDYMTDVQWSPVHSTLLATTSSSGTVSFWNFAASLDEPQETVAIDSTGGLNKLRWSLDGRRLAVAASDQVHVLSLPEEVVRGKDQDEQQFTKELLARGMLKD